MLEAQPTLYKYHPLEVRYRLFLNLWEHCLGQFKSRPFSIYTFYEDVDVNLLMGCLLSRPTSNIFFRFSESTAPYATLPVFTIAQDPLNDNSPTGECWVLIENRLPRSAGHSNRPRDFGDSVIGLLLKRLLREPNSLEKYHMEVVESHVLIFCRCLWIIHKLCLPSDRECVLLHSFLHRDSRFHRKYASARKSSGWLNDARIESVYIPSSIFRDSLFHSEYSYARKYWIKHLSNIPSGNPHVLDALERFEREAAAATLAPDEIKPVRVWLKVRIWIFDISLS